MLVDGTGCMMWERQNKNRTSSKWRTTAPWLTGEVESNATANRFATALEKQSYIAIKCHGSNKSLLT